MDSDAVVDRLRRRPPAAALWRTDTEAEDDRSTNVGGGICVDGGTLYAVHRPAELLALDAATGKVTWRARAADRRPLRADRRRRQALLLTDRRPAARAVRRATATSCGRIRRRRPTPPVSRRCPHRPMPTASWSPASAPATWSPSAARPARSPGPTAWPRPRGRNSLVDLSAHPRPAGDQGRPGLRDRPRRPDGGARPAHRPPRCGSARSAPPNTPWVAGDWMFMLSTGRTRWRPCNARRRGRLGHPARPRSRTWRSRRTRSAGSARCWPATGWSSPAPTARRWRSPLYRRDPRRAEAVRCRLGGPGGRRRHAATW